MARLTPRDVQELLQLLEDGIRLIPKLGKSKKIAMRQKIRKQYAWLVGLTDPTAGMVLHDLEERLSDLFPLYPYGVIDRLQELLKEKLGRYKHNRMSAKEDSGYLYAPRISLGRAVPGWSLELNDEST